MAKLPFVDLPAIRAKEALHWGNRPRALQILRKAVETGKAGKETLELVEYLSTAKRGRQPFGRKHLWYLIGQRNEELADAGWTYDTRIEELKSFGLATREDIAKALATYARAMEEIRAIEEEERAADLNTRHRGKNTQP